MVTLRKETEAIPSSYPSVTPRWLGGTDAASAMFDANFHRDPGAEQIWQRIEAYTRVRYTAREVIWIIDANADEEWTPPLAPLVTFEAHYWGDQWEALTLSEGPMGICLPFGGTYRITAQVGAGDPPAAVQEAFMRLHEYSRGVAEAFSGEPAVASEDGRIPMGWAARSLQLSGAADALRPYRRQK